MAKPRKSILEEICYKIMKINTQSNPDYIIW